MFTHTQHRVGSCSVLYVRLERLNPSSSRTGCGLHRIHNGIMFDTYVMLPVCSIYGNVKYCIVYS